LFAHHSINHQYHIGGQQKYVAHPTWLKQTWQVQKKTCQVKIKFGRCS